MHEVVVAQENNDPNRLATKSHIEHYIHQLKNKAFTLGHLAKCLQLAPQLYPTFLKEALQILPADSREKQQFLEFGRLQNILQIGKAQASALVKSFIRELNPSARNQAVLDSMYRRPLQKNQRREFLTKIKEDTTSQEEKAIYEKLIINSFLTLRTPIKGESIHNEILYDQQSGHFYGISAFKSTMRNNSQIKQKLTYHLTLDDEGHILGFFHTVDIKPNKQDSMKAPLHGAIEKKSGTYFPPGQEVPAGTKYVTIKNGVKLPGLESSPPFRVISHHGQVMAIFADESTHKVLFYPYQLPLTNNQADDKTPISGHLYPDGSFDVRGKGKNAHIAPFENVPARNAEP